MENNTEKTGFDLMSDRLKLVNQFQEYEKIQQEMYRTAKYDIRNVLAKLGGKHYQMLMKQWDDKTVFNIFPEDATETSDIVISLEGNFIFLSELTKDEVIQLWAMFN